MFLRRFALVERSLFVRRMLMVRAGSGVAHLFVHPLTVIIAQHMALERAVPKACEVHAEDA